MLALPSFDTNMSNRTILDKVELSRNRKILTRTLLHNGRVDSLMLVDATHSGIRISPFEFETANTIFFDGIALLLRDDTAAVAAIASLERNILSAMPRSKNFLTELCSTIEAAGLFAKETGETALYRLTRF